MKFSNVLFPLWYFLIFLIPSLNWSCYVALLVVLLLTLMNLHFNFQVLDKFIGHENSFALPLLMGNLVFSSDAYFGFMEKHFLLTHLLLNFSKIYETIFGFQSKSVAYLACPWELCDYFHLALLFLFVLSCLSLPVNGSIFLLHFGLGFAELSFCRVRTSLLLWMMMAVSLIELLISKDVMSRMQIKILFKQWRQVSFNFQFKKSIFVSCDLIFVW